MQGLCRSDLDSKLYRFENGLDLLDARFSIELARCAFAVATFRLSMISRPVRDCCSLNMH